MALVKISLALTALVAMVSFMSCRRDPPVDDDPRPPSHATTSDVPKGAKLKDTFTVQTLDRGPFQAVRIWAPPPGSAGHYETLLLLHGNQGPTPDPTWMVGLHWQPQFADRILVVPALAEEGYEWGRAPTMSALGALLDRVARDYPIDRRSVYVLGYSAGASRVLSIANAMPDRFVGIVAVAGDIARPFRDLSTSLTRLQSVPILLVCMTSDYGPHTNCRLNESNLAWLRKRGLHELAVERLEGTHDLDLARLAPLLNKWIARQPTPN